MRCRIAIRLSDGAWLRDGVVGGEGRREATLARSTDKIKLYNAQLRNRAQDVNSKGQETTEDYCSETDCFGGTHLCVELIKFQLMKQ